MSLWRLVNPTLVTVGITLLSLLSHFSLISNPAYAHNSTPNIQEDSLAVTASPSSVNRSGTVTVTATVFAHRTGGGTNTNWSVQLTLPSGYTLPNGANPQTTSTSSHGSAMVAWTVTAPSLPSGPDTFTVTTSATDALLGIPLSGSPETDTFAITTVNRDPTANDDTVTIEEDTASVVINVLANDTDADSDTLLISLISPPSNGTTQITDSNTTITYSPDTNFFGTDNLSYTIEDGFGGSATGTVTIIITSANDAPVAINDSYITDEDVILTVPDIGVLNNDTDIENDVLSAILADGVSNGTLTLYANGSFTYLPDSNSNGLDSFTYIVNDGTDNSSSLASVNITVNSVNDSPIANNETSSVDEDDQTIIILQGSDVDVGDSLTFIVISNPLHGSLTGFNASSGHVTYAPVADFNGQDSFTFLVTDGIVNSTVALVSITVNPVDEQPAGNGEDDEDDGEQDSSSRDGNNNRGDSSEEELAAKRLTYDDTYFDDNPLDRIQIQSHSILNSDGSSFSSVPKGEKVTFSYSFRNYQQKSQEYCFIVQIMDKAGMTISIQISKGELISGENADVEQEWIARSDGDYAVKLFIWDSLDNPLALSDTDTSAFRVR